MHLQAKNFVIYVSNSFISFCKLRDKLIENVVTFARNYLSTEKKPGCKTTGKCLKTALHAFNRLCQSQFFVWSFHVNVSGFGQNALINLVICKNCELMTGSQYPQTTRSLLKTGLLLIYYFTVVFVQWMKIIIPIGDGSTLSLNS